MKINIAIDGPGAAGKSTIAKLLAKKMGYVHLDTGAMYRCVSYKAMQEGIAFDEDEKLMAMLASIQITFGDNNTVFINGDDVSLAIRTNENGMLASKISQKKFVREKLVEWQREIVKEKGFILDGRDIGTVVLKDAELKIYLIASVDSRATRRYKELLSKGMGADFESISLDLQQRDDQDMNRKESPLKKAEDAIEVDTSDMSIDEVCETITSLVNKVLESR